LSAVAQTRTAAPGWDDFTIGATWRSRVGRTVAEMDNGWTTCLTQNTNQIHFNSEYAVESAYGRPLVNSVFTLALITRSFMMDAPGAREGDGAS
jgi:itaconyl-CoA hydratase